MPRKKPQYTRDLVETIVKLTAANMLHELKLKEVRGPLGLDELERQRDALVRCLTALTHSARHLQRANEQYTKRSLLGQPDAAEQIGRRRRKLREQCLRVIAGSPSIDTVTFSDDWEAPPFTVVTTFGTQHPWPVPGSN